MKINKKLMSIAISSVFSVAILGNACAAGEYPEESISIVSVWPAGGTHDISARLIAKQLSEELSVPVMVNNVTGAAGSTGMRYIENAKPNGYTIGIMGMHAISQSFMNSKATRLDEIEPIVYFGKDTGALQVSADVGIDSLSKYVAVVKEDPSSVISGSDAQGGNSYIFSEMLSRTLDVDFLKIPYRGHAPNVTALVSNEIQSATLPVPSVIEHHRAGTVNMLAVMSEERHPLLPDVPTFLEKGYNLVANDFYMVVAPAGLPENTKNILEKALLNVVSSDEFVTKSSNNGMIVTAMGSEDAKDELSRQVDLIYPLLYESDLVHESMVRD